MFTLAHLSDPHLGAMPIPGLGQLAGKRAFGFLSWNLRRKAIHDGPVLPALVADLRQAAPDHVAVTGDVTNIRSEEHTSELQSLMRISYAVFCLKKKN